MFQVWLPADCIVCGEPPWQLCSRCRNALIFKVRDVHRSNLPVGLAVADYETEAKTIAHEFKSTGSRSLARTMAAPMFAALRERVSRRESQPNLVLVPAPSRPSATKKRGYLPAQILAREVARFCLASGIEARVENCLRVSRDVSDQSLLDAEARKANLAGKVRVNLGANFRVRGGEVVLVDDIVTTGSTLASMRSALLGEGIQTEFFLTFAETL